MKIFQCPRCKSNIHFENSQCLSCRGIIGYDPDKMKFVSIGPDNKSGPATAEYCRNASFSACNWTASKDTGGYCTSCNLTTAAPDNTDNDNFGNWKILETAKRRLLYQLLRLGLPLSSNVNGNIGSLTFEFLTADNPKASVTGHADGTITILLSEADSVEREQIRKRLSEPYRTLIGHFRHEIGHYFWPGFFNGGNDRDNFRSVFGDESEDYGASLAKYYDSGPVTDWEGNYISAYASSHPHEDWAETWSHYLHLIDTLESAHFVGIGLAENGSGIIINRCPDPYAIREFDTIMDYGQKLTWAGNSLNRSMGIPDIYPFVLPEKVISKLRFVHDLIMN